MNRPSWHEYFMMVAKLVSVRSTCNSRKIGAAIVRHNRVLATGYNGAVHGAPHCIDRGPDFCLRRSIGAHDADKCSSCISSHAEVNAIDQAARFGIPLDGASLYCTLEPCNWCFKQLIQAGIREIYFEEPYNSRTRISTCTGARPWNPTRALPYSASSHIAGSAGDGHAGSAGLVRAHHACNLSGRGG